MDDDGAQWVDWVDHILLHFSFHRYVTGLDIDAALAAVREQMGDIVELLRARAARVGHVAGIHVGYEFNYRAEIFLVGLHDGLVRGISLGRHLGHEVATCVVAVFELHNTFLHEDLLIYGGEGGHLRLAYRQHVRVLADQIWSRRNIAMRNSVSLYTPVRLLVRSLMADNTYRYVYLGLFSVLDWRIVTSNGFRVYEFLLSRY